MKKAINGAKSNATITEVAEEAKVSIKTVSRVLNHEAYVSDKTKDRVLAAVKALNYKPNMAARRLAGHRSFLIALLYDNPSPSYLLNVQNGLLEAAAGAGFEVLMHPCSHEDPGLVDSVFDFVERSNVDGLILTPPLSDHEDLVQALRAQSVPMSRMAPQKAPQSLDVSTDDREAMQLLTQHLIAQGHTRIGFIKGHPDHGASAWRFQGYVDALDAASIDLDEALVVQGYFSFKSGIEAGDILLALDKLPSAIMASNDDMAGGVLQAAYRRGMTVPQDLSVTGFDDTPLSHQVWPPLTTVHQPIRSMAMTAACNLLESLGVEVELSSPPRAIVNRLVFRESVQKSHK
jgi:LacI family transcriptional regulator